MLLYFENSDGEERPIADVSTETEVFAAIQDFINECNAKKGNAKKFEWYYTRVWETDGRKHYDVGSHTEFFHWGDKN